MSTRAMAQSICPGEIAIYGQWHKAVRIKGNQNRPLLQIKQSAEGKKSEEKLFWNWTADKQWKAWP